ncbi:MAG: AbrB family transcriptional regulator [Bosea sp. (in: a-proteobacteria)]|uniref:AbrB/MazE/SpoVT family DNA-binding domain-containing protein n=1 Tax=Bosea sp. (in: a-proteobacteria) TaxID=1871050 RepID=UPI002734D823|nr:AbrB family transcriptional regulator [Bosea sp. (in: a-proteobacteria)]MDP3255665.1 AbrB family transcriptional regulator [Bosea sp. (in: a-proteobacteria)]MDP3320504.1 AbrB family transcriptional regulator [Bosea sp. (in: a-proteobacteria)]
MNEIVPPQDGDVVSDVVQLRKIGNSVGIILSKDVLARFGLAEGDRFTVVRQPDREVKLVPYDDVHARGMAFARRAFKDYADTFRELAK